MIPIIGNIFGMFYGMKQKLLIYQFIQILKIAKEVSIQNYYQYLNQNIGKNGVKIMKKILKKKSTQNFDRS